MSLYNVFTYGTLCASEVMYAVTNKTFKTEKVYLSSYERYLVKNHVFPAIIPTAEKTIIDGLIYFDVDEESLNLIDIFESYFYDRTLVEVKDESEQSYKAYAFVLNKAYHDVLSDEPWNEAVFRHLHLDKYLNRIR